MEDPPADRQPERLTANDVALRICSLLERLIDDASEEAAQALLTVVLHDVLTHLDAFVALPDDLRAARDAYLGDTPRAECGPVERVH